MKEIKVNKIILGEFIDMLIDAYGAGADYIDLVAQEGDGQDRLGVLVCEEYMNFERHDDYLSEKPKAKIGKLTTLELQRLINISIN